MRKLFLQFACAQDSKYDYEKKLIFHHESDDIVAELNKNLGLITLKDLRMISIIITDYPNIDVISEPIPKISPVCVIEFTYNLDRFLSKSLHERRLEIINLLMMKLEKASLKFSWDYNLFKIPLLEIKSKYEIQKNIIPTATGAGSPSLCLLWQSLLCPYRERQN